MGMQKTRFTDLLARVCCLGLLGLSAAPVHALGLGPGPQSVTLGQPLDLSITARLDSGESLGPECVSAEVWVGEQRAVPASVSLRPATGANASAVIIRVSTALVIDEPVVTVQLQAGCVSRVSRRYVAFADPVPAPAAVSVLPPVASLPAPPAATLPQAETLLERAPVTAAESPRAAASPAPPGPPRDAVVPSKRAEQRAARLAARRQAAAAVPAKKSIAKAATAAATQAAPAATKQAKLAPTPAAQAAPTPRLRLDPVDATTTAATAGPEVIEQAFAAVSQAASAARASAAAASAAAERMAALERTLERAKSEARGSQSEIERLRALVNRPLPAQDWFWPLIAVMLAVALLAAWLAWRLRAMQRTQEVAWARASAFAAADVPTKETSPLPLINTMPPQTTPSALSRPEPLSAASDDADDADGPGSGMHRAMARTVVLPPTARVDEASPRDVSIEELIDIDQQAEFFIALGQDSAAIDMLVAHLRNTGGGSPLTYLKLLEIYRRVGDHDAYERTRTRFNQRYNAYAPQWGADLAQGKSLEDYDAVVPRLTQAWTRPLDAMAELEALLFRKSRGELFDLPAYRDVLFLYALARDLMDREPSDADQVDLLLPLDAAARAAMGDMSDMAVGNRRARSDMPADDQPTAPLDLDLTPARSQESIFGEPLQPTVNAGRTRR